MVRPLALKHRGSGSFSIASVVLSNQSFNGNAPSGTTVGVITVSLSAGTFTGTLGLSGTNQFQIVGNTLQTNGVLATGTYSINIVATQPGASNTPLSVPFTITGNLVISSVNLSNSSFVGGSPTGTTVGVISVVMSSGSFTGTLGLSGMNTNNFQLVGSTLQTNGVDAAGPYSINIVATQSGASNSPLPVPFTITGTSSGTRVFTPVSDSSGNLLNNYKLVWDEEFNGTTLDSTKWQALSGTGSGAVAGITWSPSNVAISGGFCRMSMTASSGGSPPTTVNSAQLWSGSSGFHFAPNTYLEARLKLPNDLNGAGTGLVPAMWGNGFYNGGANQSDPPEIDFAEWRLSRPGTGSFVSADFPKPPDGHFSKPIPTGFYGTATNNDEMAQPDGSTAFHVYGMWWQSTTIDFYVDGNRIGTLTNGQIGNDGVVMQVYSTPIDLIFWISWNQSGTNVSSQTVFPATMIIDYVHVYTQNGTAVTAQTNYGGPGDATGSGNTP